MLDHQEEGDEEAEIADAIDDECFFAGGCGGVFREPEADQQVRGETDALPTDEHHQVVLREHQREHEEHEEVEVGHEAVVAVVIPHVADRINVDEEADAGDDQQHDERKLVEVEAEINLEVAGADPVREVKIIGGGSGREAEGDEQRQRERRSTEGESHRRDCFPGRVSSEEAIDCRSRQRENREQPEIRIWRHSLSRFTWSTFNVSRVR